ncbi:unnamed protein product, partial [marine sediment metagenome]
MSEVFGEKTNKKQALKDLIKKLHEGTDLEQVKKDFR